MTNSEFSNTFDVLYNNITSNKAAGLNEYEKSVFLTKAQNEIVRNYFESGSAGNTVKKGFDDSAIRQVDFSNLLTTVNLEETTGDTAALLDVRAKLYVLPKDKKILIIVNEAMHLGETKTETVEYRQWNDSGWTTVETSAVDTSKIVGTYDKTTWEEQQKESSTAMAGKDGDVVALTGPVEKIEGLRQIVPLTYDEYMRLMSKPFKEPLKWQAWRLITQGTAESSNTAEIVLTSADRKKYTVFKYSVRYVRRPRPIILTGLGDAFGEEVSIDGETGGTEGISCELNEAVHDAIVQRAVELAKVAWEGDVNQTQMHITAGQRTE